MNYSDKASNKLADILSDYYEEEFLKDYETKVQKELDLSILQFYKDFKITSKKSFKTCYTYGEPKQRGVKWQRII